MRTLGYDVRDVNEWVSDCHIDEIVKHELDYEYPNRNDYIVELQIDVEGEPLPFYVKIKLPLPSMETGVVLSFHL